MRKKTLKKRLWLMFGGLLLVGYLIPQRLQMPVAGATRQDFNPETFWYYPWGKSVTHKGVDIFARKGTAVVSSTVGWVVFTGALSRGGKSVLVLGPGWRLHYYTHLNRITARQFSLVSSKDTIGAVGNTGNAATTQPHLHYSIMTLIPYPWHIDRAPQGWKKMFYLNPVDYL